MRLPILRLVLLLAALLPCAANAAGFQPDQQYTNWLNQYRNQVKGQSPKLSTNELEQLAMTLARSNRLVQILPEMLFEAEPDFEHAAELLKEFPGGVNALTRYGQPILHSAIDYNRANTMEFLLQQKANPNVSANNRPVLLEAMQNGRWDMALMLIKAGAVVTVTNSSGENAGGLFFERWYPGNGQMSPGELVPLLLTNGLDVFQATRTGTETAIIEDCLQREQGYRYNGRSGSTPAFSELLLTNNASPIRRTPHGDTALHLAVHNGYTNIIEVLLQNGFTIDQTNSAGLTPLQDLVGAGKANIVISPGAPMPPTPRSAGATNVPSVPQTISAYLLSRDATLDIFSAAGLGLTNELAAMLAKNPALAKARDSFGRTPLHYALLNGASFAGSPYFGGFLGFGGIRGQLILNSSMPRGSGYVGRGWPGTFPSSGGAPVPSNGIPATVTLLLNAGTDPSAATTQEVPGRYSAAGLAVGTTPLHLAARNGDTPVMRALLNARADVQLADGNGDTALHFAARTWQTNALTLLLNARAPLEVTNRNSHTPLRTAVESSVTPAVATLLDAGANHTNGLGGNTLLHIAVTRNDRNTTTLLLKRKFALESRDATGNTPLQAAALAHSVDMVKFLRDQGADFNATNFTGNSVLHLLAAQQDDTVYHAPDESAFAEWERKQFATGSWVSRGLAALMKAKLLDPLPPQGWTNYSLSKWLIDHGTIANVTNRAGQNPLHIVCSADWIRWYYGNQHSNRVAALLNAGVRLDQPDTNGMTPLHLVATNSWQQGQIFKLLLAKAGPTLVNQPDARGHTLLHRAVEGARDNFEGVTALLAIGANVNAQDTNGATALHVLVSLPQDGWMYRRREMAMMLLTNKANPNLTDKQGRTPLFIAMSRLSNYNEWNQRELITTLLTNGANPNLADRDGNTAVHAYLLATNSSSRFSFRDPMHSALKARADFSLTNRLGVTPLQLLAETKSPYSHPLHMLTDFLDLTNAAFTVRGPDGNTPLHQFAARSPNCPQCGDVLGKLLAVEGRSSLTNFSGQTPLDILSATNSRSWLASRVFAASSNNPKALASTDASGQPLLHRMMQSLPLNNYDTQQFFRRALTNKSLINLTNTDGDTPLHIALRQRDSFFARQLVEAGADRKLANAKGETPVRLAAINFPFGPTILNPPDTRLPFFGAVRSRGNNNDFDRWLDFDPGLATITNRDGVTPLMAASEARNTHVVEKLLALGVPIDALSALRLGRLEDFRSLLTQVKLPLPAHWMFEAVRFDRLEGLQILATNGCNVKAVDADGHSLLFHARAANQTATIDWLTGQGCRETLFDFIANNDRTATAAMLDADKPLLEKPNDRGRLPIVAAVATGKSEIVADLIKRGAKVDVTVDDGWNLLHLAAATDAIDAARLLLQTGVATNALSSNSGLSALGVAAIYGATNVAALLLENGAPVNIQAEGGFKNAPLHWAAHMGQTGMVRLLLAHGADVKLKNNRNGGETALDLAKLPGNSVGMGFNSPSEAGQYPRRSQIPAEEREAMVKLLEEAAAKN